MHCHILDPSMFLLKQDKATQGFYCTITYELDIVRGELRSFNHFYKIYKGKQLQLCRS